MNPLLIVRTDILSSLIILFLIFYDRYCARFREGEDYFFGVAVACLGHDVMALVTELTVNSETVPKTVNDAAHMLFFFFAVLYGLKYFEYALALILPKKDAKKYRIGAYVVCLCAFVVLLVSPIEYLQGRDTRYSAGIGATLCYAMGFLLLILADVIMILNRKRIDDAVIYSLLPISSMALVFLLVQILVPEFLFTGAAMTLMVLGLFCATENPVGKLQRRANVDLDTQAWNRNCYEHDMERTIRPKAASGVGVVYVLGDINGLKQVNDTLGHQNGDKLLADTARVLTETLYHAYRVYRVGGDEFAAVYLDKELALVREEVALAGKKCEEFRFGENVPVGISFGIAEKEKTEDLSETIRRADREMYAAKDAYYREHHIDRRRNR